MQKITDELVTVRDYIRYGVSKFNKANLFYGHGTDNAFDEAVYLVMEMLDLPIDGMEFSLDAKLTNVEREKLIDTIDRRIKTRKPAPYLTNKVYLDNYCFYVDERVNIPRLFLGEQILSNFESQQNFALSKSTNEIQSVLDLCAGAGVLSVVAAQAFPNAHIDAIDVSVDALEVAKINIKSYCLEDRVTLFEGDLFKPVAGKKYDLILSNPPYLSNENKASMPPEYSHEPKRAIDSGADGLKLIKRIINSAADYLEDNGMLICEVGNTKKDLEAVYPHLNFMWFDELEGQNSSFWLNRENLLF